MYYAYNDATHARVPQQRYCTCTHIIARKMSFLIRAPGNTRQSYPDIQITPTTAHLFHSSLKFLLEPRI